MSVNPDRKTPEWVEVIEAVVDRKLCNVFTMMPGKIVSFDKTTDRATVQPLLKRFYKAEQISVELPLISEVPVCWPSMGKSKLRLPLSVDDEGEIHFQMRSIDSWIDTGGAVDPADNRKFSISDATFWPGLRSAGQVVPSRGRPNALEILNDKMMIELLPSGKIAIKNLATGDELLDLFSQMLDSLVGESFIFNKAALTLLKAKLTQMKG